ncbi:MAG: GNAT family N-acetyltransferase [Gemmatimonadetes bacterium]|nr:GNAT family N-acetyltransferase [Gemmatimonadota bacterium]
MSGEAELRIDEEVSAEDRDAVLKGLRAFNVAQIGPANDLPLELVVRDAEGTVIGGLLGNTKWGWLYVDKLWISEAARGQGFGSRLLARAEEIARERGCIGTYLSTFEHQARPFYEARGYQLFGTLDGFPAATRQFYLCKRFGSAAHSVRG